LGYAYRGGYLDYVLGHGYTVIVLPYLNPDLQLVILLPDKAAGLASLELALTPEIIAGCTNVHSQSVNLFLPKFTLEPPALSLTNAFQTLGMKSAFNLPPGSANFDRIAPRHADEYLLVSEIRHQTFITINELGTEAAAATAGGGMAVSGMETPPKPLQVHVDHPFLFFIQHRPTGVCLFLGRVTDPR